MQERNSNKRKLISITLLLTIIIQIAMPLILKNISQAETSSNGPWDISKNQDGSITATLSEDGTLTISGTGEMKGLTFNNKPWESAKKVVIENGVTSIGDFAFCGCRSLTNIEIPSSITSIGKYALYECRSLTNIEIPSSVTSVGERAFYECSSLTNIEIPSSVTSIGNLAFYQCSSLTSIEVDEGNTEYSSKDGVLFNKEKTEIKRYPAGKQGTSYIIPSSVTSIGDYAFSGCRSLTNIEIPSSVTSIGNLAFYQCSSLTSIEVDEGNTEYSSKDGVLFNKEKTEIKRYPAGKQGTSYIIPSSVTSIGDWAFYGCRSLTNIEIPSSITSIGYRTFYGCRSLTNIEIPSGVTSIGDIAFYECRSLTNIEIPSSVTSIGDGTFMYCSSLTNIEIPSSVTSIGNLAFYGCSSLTNIEIPSSVTSIGDDAFYGCSSLTNIKIPSSVTSIGDDAFYNAELTIAVANGANKEQEIELPDIIKRAQKEDDILYSEEGFTLTNCSLNEDGTKLKVNTDTVAKEEVSLEVKEGNLYGLVVVVVPSGTIAYNTVYPTNKNVTATLYVVNEETITNNNGNNTYTFTENGKFTFTYTNAKGEQQTATATVDWIDKTAPTAQVSYSTTSPTNKNVTATITANEELQEVSGWTLSSDKLKLTKEYTTNANETVTIKDLAGNVTQVSVNFIAGDINSDGNIDTTDMLLLKRHLIAESKTVWKLTGEKVTRADINKDGKVDISDLLVIKRTILNNM